MLSSTTLYIPSMQIFGLFPVAQSEGPIQAPHIPDVDVH